MSVRFQLPFADVGNGIEPSDGAALDFFIPGTSTRKDTYSDDALTTPNANPVIADSDGVFSDIWTENGARYKVVLKDKDNVQIWEADPVGGLVDFSAITAVFDTVADLKASDSLEVDQLVSTKGYYTAGDGGHADYLVAATQSVDGYGDHSLANSNVALLQHDGVVNVRLFGSVGDGATDDSAEIQAAIDHYKALVSGGAWIGNAATTNPHNEHGATLYFPQGVYSCNSSLWFGSDDDTGEDYDDSCKNIVAEPGAVIYSNATGKLAMDFSGVQNIRMSGLTLFGDGANTPDAGFFLARSGDSPINPSAGNHKFTDVAVIGNYNVASVYNYASEINVWTNCAIKNSKAASEASVLMTSNNAREALSSEFTTTAVTEQSSYGDRFVNTDINYDVDGTGTNAAVICESVSFGPKFAQCYFDLLQGGATKAPVIRMRDAQGATGTSARNIGLSLDSCVSEAQFDSIVRIENNTRSVRLQGNNFSGAATTADIHITATGALRDTDIQVYKGSTNIDEMVLQNDSGTLESVKRAFYPIDAVTAWSYTESGLTLDGVWNEIDLAADLDIPLNAAYVSVKVLCKNNGTIGNANKFSLRGDGVTQAALGLEAAPAVSGIDATIEGLVEVVGGKIQYKGSADYGQARILVRGFYS
jgi:hypothetical protein